MAAKIDDFDRKILSLIQRNNMMTTTEIGSSVGMSKSAAQRRLASMRENKVIVADVAVVDPDEAGPFLTFFLMISLKNAETESMSRFETAIADYVETQQCYHMAGPIDYMAIVNVRDQARFAEISKELLYENPDIERFESSLVVDRTKVGMELPL